MAFTVDDQRHMARAIQLAWQGLYTTSPNPRVGCVLVKDGVVVGEGFHLRAGEGHAEVNALAAAGEQARGATAYVTLEPCSHQGQTPPCADALIAAGVARVVAAVQDSDPRVSGEGFARLRAAGVEVTTGVCSEEAHRDLAGFFLKVEQGRPWLTLKLATSLDGRIATATGESKWITGPAARRAVHLLRATHDAVMVGGGTARADDPQLNVRGFPVPVQPVRVVVSRFLDLPLMGQLARTAREVPVWICHGPDVQPEMRRTWEGLGARLFPCRLSQGRVDASAALHALGAAGLTRVFCEGGGQLAASLLSADLVDELHLFSAGVALGAEGHPGLGALGIARLEDAPRYVLADLSVEGGDVHQVWRRAG